MPLYSYKAKNLKGEEVSGILDVANEHQLATDLHDQGFFLSQAVKLQEDEDSGKKLKPGFLASIIQPSLTEKLFFTRNLALMIRTGVALVRALEMLAGQTKNKSFQRTLFLVAEKVKKGDSLFTALSQAPKAFSVMYRETVKVGEEAGKLDEVLKMLSLQIEREHSLKSKIKSAMVYPLVVLGVTVGIGALLLVFAVPTLKKTFADLNLVLPFTTRVILGVSDFAIKNWPWVVSVILLLVFAIALFLRTAKGGRFKSKLALGTAPFNKVVRQVNSAIVLRNISSLLASGVPIVRALELSSGAVNNFYFRNSLKEAMKRVEKGERLSLALKPYHRIFSPMVLQMMELGEETGETASVLEQLADFLEEEVANSVAQLSSMIEPLLILLVGAGVGFFAISMMQPMFSVMQGIR
ncbi:MAG: type II secretion system F family protein [Patescibacteria group bacterium]|nr:type II secretion system F family protein [Patescibacteria group bacterium]